MFQIAQSANQGLAEVTRASCDQHSHARLIPPAGGNRNPRGDYGTSHFHNRGLGLQCGRTRVLFRLNMRPAI
jgi:hypothetical protein